MSQYVRIGYWLALCLLPLSLFCGLALGETIPNCSPGLYDFRFWSSSTQSVLAIYHWPPDPWHHGVCSLHNDCYWGVPISTKYTGTFTSQYSPDTDIQYVATSVNNTSFYFVNACGNYFDWAVVVGAYSTGNEVTLEYYDEANRPFGTDRLGQTLKGFIEATTSWRVRIGAAWCQVAHDAALYSTSPTLYSIGETTVHELGHALVFGYENVLGDGQYKVASAERTYSFGGQELATLQCVYGPQMLADCNQLVYAECADFAVAESGLASWRVMNEYATDHYEIQGRTTVGGEWLTVVSQVLPGVGDREVSLPSPLQGQYRLIEWAASGFPAILAYASPAAPFAAAAQLYSDDIGDAIEDLLQRIAAGQYSQQGLNVGSGESCMVVGPGAWLAVVDSKLGPLWSGLWGYAINYLPTESLSSDPDTAREEIRAAIRAAHEGGTKYVLLLGDANDYRQFVGDQASVFWNTAAWEDKRIAMLASGVLPGEQERDVVPTYYVADNDLPPSLNMSRVTPYWYTDQYYADVNDDGSPDVALGRWPVSSEGEVLSLVLKTLRYNDNSWGTDSYAVDVYEGDLAYRTDPYETMVEPDGPTLRQAASDIVGILPEGSHVWERRMSECANLSGLTAYFSELWNVTYPELVYVLSNGSNRYSVGGFINSYDPTVSNVLTAMHSPVLVAPTCAVNDIARSCSVDKPYPMIELLLKNAWTGPIGCVAPTGGSVQAANMCVARHMAESLFAQGDVTIAEAARSAIAHSLQEFPEEDQLRNTVRSYSYLGDPLSRLCNHSLHAVGVGDDDVRPGGVQMAIGPNPASGRVAVKIDCADKSADLRVEIFNVRGERIRTIRTSAQSGGGNSGLIIDWDGADSFGRRVPSGRYIVRAVVGGRTAIGRVSIVR